MAGLLTPRFCSGTAPAAARARTTTLLNDRTRPPAYTARTIFGTWRAVSPDGRRTTWLGVFNEPHSREKRSYVQRPVRQFRRGPVHARGARAVGPPAQAPAP